MSEAEEAGQLALEEAVLKIIEEAADAMGKRLVAELEPLLLHGSDEQPVDSGGLRKIELPPVRTYSAEVTVPYPPLQTSAMKRGPWADHPRDCICKVTSLLRWCEKETQP